MLQRLDTRILLFGKLHLTNIPGGEVAIIDVGKGVTTNVITNADGNYIKTQLTPGSYEIAITKPGFKKFQQQNLTVSVGRSARVDVVLQIGEATQEITVSSAPPELVTDRAEVQTHLGAEQISSLPVVNRNFTNLSLLTPGATLNTYQHAASENPQQSTLVNTNGQLFGGTNYQLDGMNDNDKMLGIVMVNPAVTPWNCFQLRRQRSGGLSDQPVRCASGRLRDREAPFFWTIFLPEITAECSRSVRSVWRQCISNIGV